MQFSSVTYLSYFVDTRSVYTLTMSQEITPRACRKTACFGHVWILTQLGSCPNLGAEHDEHHITPSIFMLQRISFGTHLESEILMYLVNKL